MKTYRKYSNYIEITECMECGKKGPANTLRYHLVDPCHLCGGKRIEKVARFAYFSRPWWKFWSNRGRWQVK